MYLNKNELLSIKGGFCWTIAGIIGAGITFIIGVIDGYLRPNKCLK